MQTTLPMEILFLKASRMFGRFERWFDEWFGWFFTNGMKERRRT